MGSGAAEATDKQPVSGGGGGSGGEVNLRICGFNGSKYSVQISLDSTVGSLKSVVAQSCDVAPERQRLIYTGRVLMDDRTLESYGLEADHTIHLVRGSAPPPATSAVIKRPNSNPRGTRSAGSSEGSGVCRRCGVGASFYYDLVSNGLTRDSELFGPGLPILQQVQQRLIQNPNLMREILSMPSVHNTVDNLNLMQNVIMNDPHMYELIDRNPELAHILTDPSTIRRMLEAARNPELMREMMRDNDRAASYAESCPEGCSRLRGLYENAEEPFLNAGNSDSEFVSNSSAPNTTPLPNPWASAGGAYTNSNIGYYPAGYDRVRAHGGHGGQLDYQFGSTDTASLSQSQSLLSHPLNQQLLTLRRALQSRLSRQQSAREGLQARGISGPLNHAELETFSNRFGGLGVGTTSNGSNLPPEELYASQLLQLQEMGFMHPRENLQALIAAGGNVRAAVARLLGNLGQ